MEIPCGKLYLSAEDGKIVRISCVEAEVSESCEVLEVCRMQMEEYFEKKRRSFDLPLAFEGTDFQKAVWKAMMQIEYGKVVSYAQLAQMAGYPKALRALGTACGHNPIGIVIPCHRVIRSDGSTGNYAWGSEMKQFLIDLEKER